MSCVFLILPALALLGATSAPQPVAPQASPARVISPVPSTCKQIGTYAQADQERPGLKRLGELPGAQTFMAVDRRIDHCPAPLTLTDYRNPRRR